MARITFIGDRDGDGPAVMRAFGLDFPKGVPVDVEDPAIAAKLAGNGHFVVEGEAVTGAPAPTTRRRRGGARDDGA